MVEKLGLKSLQWNLNHKPRQALNNFAKARDAIQLWNRIILVETELKIMFFNKTGLGLYFILFTRFFLSRAMINSTEVSTTNLL